MIMADDIGYECYQAYGGTSYKTPVLNKMAAAGMRFTHAYSNPVCTPTRVKLMTGLSNVRNYASFSILKKSDRTIGHMMQEAGYKTMVWDGTNNNGHSVATGVYIYRMQAGDFVKSQKMLFTK